MQSVKAPLFIGNLREVHDKIVFDANPKGIIKVWELPYPKMESVVIGADVAEGLEKGDYSTAQVIGTETLKQYAEMRCHYAEDVFAEEIRRLGRWFYEPLIGIERNNMGIAVIHPLKDVYTNLFYMEEFEEKTQVRRKKWGWVTNLKTKPLMIAELDRIIREELAKIASDELLSELMTYIKLADGSTEAQEGCYDDLVMAYAIALQMIKFAPLRTEKKKHQFDYEDSPKVSSMAA